MRKNQLRKILSAALCFALLATGCAPAATDAAMKSGSLGAARNKTGKAPVSTMAAVEIPAPLPLDTVLPDLEAALAPLAESQSLAIPTTFAITRPTEKLTTTYASYFITGTSDPSQPVYFGNSEIQRLGTKGTFGVYVELAMGTNSFTFRQGDKSATVVIERRKEGVALIKEIRQDSMVPSVHSGIEAGQSITAGCTAPYGATVKASFDGKTVALKPSRQDIPVGYPVNYTGKITVDNGPFEPGVTRKIGKITYEMSYSGSTKTYQSTGDVYVAGEGGRIAVEVSSYLGFVYPDTSNLSVFKETVKTGARDYIKSQNNLYFELASGGFISKEMVRIVEGEVAVKNKLTGVSASAGGKADVIAFTGSRRPVYDSKIADNVLSLTFYNTSGTPGADVSACRLTSGATVSEDGGSVTYKFPLKGRVWGYDVSFDGSNTVLTMKYKPTSISGMTIVLDPGHGGTDPGALGLAGKTGPSEADVNLANALAVRDALTQLGATVVMTRTGDSYLSLDDRLKLIETSKADVFVSLHHNSIGENVDANKVSGMEIYYHTGLSQSFANSMMGGLATNLNRNNRAVKQSYYRVTLMPYAPAVLVELGFMSNPVEYEKAASQSEMSKVAEAVADGIARSLQ